MVPLFAFNKKKTHWKFPGGLVIRIQRFHCCGPGSIPGQGTEISQTSGSGQKGKKKKKDTLYLHIYVGILFTFIKK